MNETPHYYAFISYSHEDKNLVAAFHDRLENYEIPFYFRKKRKKIPSIADTKPGRGPKGRQGWTRRLQLNTE